MERSITAAVSFITSLSSDIIVWYFSVRKRKLSIPLVPLRSTQNREYNSDLEVFICSLLFLLTVLLHNMEGKQKESNNIF